MLKTLTTVALALSIFAGCQQRDPVMAPAPGYADLLPIQDYPQIAVTSGLAPFLGFSKPIVLGPDEGKPMSVSVPVRLLDDRAVSAQYKFEFYDRSGRLLKPEATFRLKQLPARVQVDLEGAALDTSAVEWRLIVRSAR